LLDRRNVRRLDQDPAVDLTCLERLNGMRVVPGRLEAHPAPCRLLTPGVSVLHARDLLADDALLDIGLASPGRMAERVRSEGVEGAVSELALVRAVLLHRRRALHRERGDDEGRQERRRLGRQVDDGRVLTPGRAALVEALREIGAVVVLVA